ncbi:hypothetical protein J6590_070158 [Homalodisca vitripennis]|nr:hypothetical protein J6590_070158 [Homalodisca vitripennis]
MWGYVGHTISHALPGLPRPAPQLSHIGEVTGLSLMWKPKRQGLDIEDLPAPIDSDIYRISSNSVLTTSRPEKHRISTDLQGGVGRNAGFRSLRSSGLTFKQNHLFCSSLALHFISKQTLKQVFTSLTAIIILLVS